MTWCEQGESKIYYEESGAGEPLLLLPGWGGSIEDLAGVRLVLKKEFRVIAADPPGSGRSGPQPRTYTTTYYADDSRALYRDVEGNRAPIRRTLLVSAMAANTDS